MPIAINPEERQVYILEEEQGNENATVFFLQAPPSSKKSRIQAKFMSLLIAHKVNPEDYIGREHEMPMEIAVEYGLITLEEVLVGWENFLDGEGRKVPFKTANPRANIDRLSQEDQEELGAEAQKLLGFTGEEAKNSSGLSTSPDSPKNLSAEKSVDTGTTAQKKTKAAPRSGK